MPAETGDRDHILIVDDTPESLRFLVDTLEQEGMVALVATSGDAAIELLEHVTPDLILMDALMPGLNGFEATRRIKRDTACAHVPVIFMTGLTEPEHAIAALESGGVDYVRKPVVVEELLARIRVHLSNARLSHRSLMALDLSGRHLLALNRAGALLWCTPQAEKLLAQIAPDGSPPAPSLPVALKEPVQHLLQHPARTGSSCRVEFPGVTIELATIESERSGETLIRITEIREGADAALLRRQIGLTQREAEVLLWVSYGKSNRTISEILGISPRTVNKHLQQIFTKLGVETRAAAAALAVRAISG